MITIKQQGTSVEVTVDTSTYLFNPEQYAELWHTMRTHTPSDVLWSSVVTKEMIDPEYVGQAIDELDDYVAQTCMQYTQEEDN